jgi:hypothetical protein
MDFRRSFSINVDALRGLPWATGMDRARSEEQVWNLLEHECHAQVVALHRDVVKHLMAEYEEQS